MRNVKWILLAAGLAIVIGLGLRWRHHQAVETDLLAEAPYRVLKRHEPASFQKVLAGYRRMRAGTSTRAEYVKLANQEVGEVATRRFATASEASVLALMRATLPVVKALERKSPEACFAFWFPEARGIPDLEQFIAAEDQRRLLELQAEVIRSSAEEPSPPPAAAEVDGPLSEVINGMYRRYGNDVRMLSQVDDPALDRAKACAMTTSLYESIMALPPQTSGRLMRGLVGRS
jgi:hypothetical protein